MRLNDTEKRLLTAVRAGVRLRSKGKIRARVLRRMLLSLSIARSATPAATAVGFAIEGARIVGRIELDRVDPADGRLMPPISFYDCVLEGGFSGRHGHFGTLSFGRCRFVDWDRNPLAPSIDLTDAAVDGELDMSDARPEGFGEPGRPPEEPDNHFWVRATGARIDGNVKLSFSILRAPRDQPGRRMSDPAFDALSLSIAEIGGDVLFVHGRSEGRISGRGMRVAGDVWMSGASLSNPGKDTLFFQGARIEGMLILDGRPERMGEKGAEIRPFESHGKLNLLAIEVRGAVLLRNVDLHPDDNGVCLNLERGRLGSSLEIDSEPRARSCIRGRLALARLHVKTQFRIERCHLGEADKAATGATIRAQSLVAGAVRIANVEPLPAGDPATGWFAPEQQWLSIDLSDASVQALRVRDSRLTGPFRASPLRCADNVELHGRIGGEVGLEGAKIGGSLDISGLRMDADARFLSLRDGAIAHALRLARTSDPGARPPQLARVRRVPLNCFRDTLLIETLWRFETRAGKTRYRQTAFLRRKGVYHLLDRRTDILGDFVKRYGHAVADPRSAEEFFRLHCDYGPSELRFRWLIAAPDQLPPFAAADPLQVPPRHQSIWTAPPAPGHSHLAAPLDGAAALGSLAEIDFIVECDEDRRVRSVRNFAISARLICDDLLARARFRLFIPPRRLVVQPLTGPERGVRLTELPIASGQIVDHPQTAGSVARWVTTPVLEGTVEVGPVDLPGLEARLRPLLSSGFSMQGEIDLESLSCTTLDDHAGRLWGPHAHVGMNHFIYRHATWESEDERPSKRIDARFLNWACRSMVEWLWPLCLRLPAFLRDRTFYWEPWQIRLRWIYQQFADALGAKPRLHSISRYPIHDFDYRAQPFEQAIRVARAEGREDFATHFEMRKFYIEWRLFNRRVRWRLAILGLILGGIWLWFHGGSLPFIAIAALATVLMMALISAMDGVMRKAIACPPVRRAVMEVFFYVPAVVLVWLDGWFSHPFHFIVAFLIYIGTRSTSVLSHAVMRLGFGYLRRPVRAAATLILAFLVGWGGVHLANARGMLVIDAEPVADLAAPDDHAAYPKDYGLQGRPILMGSRKVAGGPRFARELSCAATLSEPLYALDVMIPLVDLREESRCEVRRVPDPARQLVHPGNMNFGRMLDLIPDLPLNDNRFWWWMKALYAIAGWFIVSLSILTFAHANRVHAEPPTEKK